MNTNVISGAARSLSMVARNGRLIELSSKSARNSFALDTQARRRGRTGQPRAVSRERLFDHDPSDVGKPLVAAAVEVGEPSVVEPHQMEDRRVEVGDVRSILDGVEA